VKFSVLLPTRNRLELLRYAVETVRRQDYDDWEIVISDNCSEEDVAGYVRSLGDARVRYYRTESFISVTDNWNNALEKSTGDYVIMLGDDDGLMQGYFTDMHRVIEDYDHPDAIYTKAFQYAYPGVKPDQPEGSLESSGCADFLKEADAPFWLDKSLRLKLVRQTLDFRYRYDLNMQYTTVSRKFIDSLRGHGEFYQSQFPDYYATSVTFLKAERVLVLPRPLVIIGIAPKSYGFFHFNQQDAKGKDFLKGAREVETPGRLRRVVMSGTNINDGWLSAMETIKKNYGAEYRLRVNYRRYRLLQAVFVFDNGTAEGLAELKTQMRLWERVLYGGGFYLYRLARRFMRPELGELLRLRLLNWCGQYPFVSLQRVEGCYNNLIEVFEQSDPLGRFVWRDTSPPYSEQSSASHKICVAHLIWQPLGLEPFRRFAASYLKHRPSLPHELVLILNGFSEPPDERPYREALGGAPFRALFLPGKRQDIRAYFDAAQRIDCEYICFLNSHSVILDDDWLATMYRHGTREDIGVVGASGSWTSRRSATMHTYKRRSAYDTIMSDVENHFPAPPYEPAPGPALFELSEGLKGKIRGMSLPRRLALRSYYYGVVAPYYLVTNSVRFRSEELREKLKYQQEALLQLRMVPAAEYDTFPAPHLRSNAFMIRREVMLKLTSMRMATKEDAYRFESGKDSMTNQVLRMGLNVLVVGRDGCAYEKEKWPQSETLWQGEQRNLLVADNQTRDYAGADAFRRAVLSAQAWGREAAPGVPVERRARIG
jgi:glycosyltransferase involved in cell wall biosynthesis